MNPNAKTTKRTPPTTEQIRAEQKRQADKGRAAQQAAAEQAAAARAASTAVVPATTASNAVAVPSSDGRTAIQKWQDDNAPATIVGRLLKFSKGVYTTRDDNTTISDDTDFVALVDQMLAGWQKFNSDGAPPDRVMGLPYDGFIMPPRESLGDNDPTTWELGLDGRPQDRWQNTVYLVLQNRATDELFTFTTSSDTGRRAVGNLTRHYDRLQKTNPDSYPIVRLKVSGFQHRDSRVGWVATPIFVVVGRAPKDSAVRPDTSLAAQMSDEIPFS